MLPRKKTRLKSPPRQAMPPPFVPAASFPQIPNVTPLSFTSPTTQASAVPYQSQTLPRVNENLALEEYFTFSHKGIGCQLCQTDVKTSVRPIQEHLMKHHGRKVDPSELSNFVRQAQDIVRSINPSFVSKETGYVCSCGTVYKYLWNWKHHSDQNPDHKVQERQDLWRTSCFRLVVPESTKRTKIATDYESIKKQLMPFIRPDEMKALASYVSLLSPDLDDRRGNVAELAPIVKDQVALATDDPTNSQLYETVYHKTHDWILKRANMEAGEVPANYRAALQTFEGQSVNELHHNYTYTFRHDPKLLFRELVPLLKYAVSTGQFNNFDNTDDFAVPYQFTRWMTEKREDGKLPFIVKYCSYRAFRISKAGVITMISCGTWGSHVSAVLSAMRAAVCSLIKASISEYHIQASNLIKDVRDSEVLHRLSPMIRKLRDIQSKKPERCHKTIDDCGDIAVRDFEFSNSIWSNIVPIWTGRMEGLFKMLCDGKWFQTVVDCKVPVNVQQLAEGELVVEVEECEDYFMEELPIILLKKVEAHLMLAFHGFGGGAMRHTELEAMEMLATSWHRHTVYYDAASIKKYNTDSETGHVTQRKLPPICARYFLLYRMLLRHKSLVRASTSAFPPLPESAEKYDMTTAVQEMFHFKLAPNKLVIRQFWTSVSNFEFPSGESTWEGVLTASKEAAEMAGHSVSTHTDRYSAQGTSGKEPLFNRWHSCLGDRSHLQVSGVHLNSQDLSRALASIFGEGASYLTEGQKDLVNMVCSKQRKHALVNLPCGEGKSLAWQLPAVASSLTGKEFGTAIVVLPYKFLAEYHFDAMKMMLKSVSTEVAIRKFSPTEITEEELPQCLSQASESQMLPSVIFLCLKTAKNLLLYHSVTVKQWVASGMISSIFVDEIHTIFAEESFRKNSYEFFCELPLLMARLVYMSGTLPQFTLHPLIQKLGLSAKDDCSDVDVIQSDDLFSDLKQPFPKDFRIGVVQSNAYVDVAVDEVYDFIRNSSVTGGKVCVQVVVATKLDGCLMKQRLEKKSKLLKVAYVSSDIKEVKMAEIASQWKAGGHYGVLVTTTCGLVGIESDGCRMVAIVGHLYSLLQVGQAMNRLRPKHRKSGGRILFSVPPCADVDEEEKDKARFERATELGYVPKNSSKQYNQCFTVAATSSFVQHSTTCLLVDFATRLGAVRSTPCQACDGCRAAPLVQAAMQVEMNNTVSRGNKEAGRALLDQLQTQCLVCKSRRCPGEGLGGCGSHLCFFCGSADHKKLGCPFGKVNPWQFLGSNACYKCWRFKDPNNRHGFDQCGPIKSRLKRLIQYKYQTETENKQNETFPDYVRKVYGHEDKFYEYLASCTSCAK